jgi:F-type H+-transporting ATPase subunit delta
VEDTRVARRYATALFQAAKQYDVVQAVLDDLASFEGLLNREDSFRRFFQSPSTSREEKLETLEKVFSDRITALTMQLIRVMLQKGREHEIQAVRAEFVKLHQAAEGIVQAVVTSAIAMDEKQKKALLAKLEATQGKKFDADFQIDPNMMGGIKVAFGSNVLDGTVRGALSRLRDQLRHDVLKQA